MKNLLTFFLLSLLIFSCQKEEVHDIIIIGGGLMGSSAGWHLSNADQKVLLIEQQDSVYTYGSSQGEARIARSLGPKNDKWSYLHNRSVAETEKLIDFLNEGASIPNYSMEQIYTTSPVSYVRHLKQLGRIENIMDGQTDKYEFAETPEEAARLFDVDMPDTTIMLREYKKHSGTVNPKNLIGHLHIAIRRHGNTVKYNHKVTQLVENNGLFELSVKNVKTGEIKTLTSRKVVSAAGPYTGGLLKEVAPVFGELIHPERVFLAFFKIDKDVYDSFSQDEKNQLMNSYPLINSSKGTRDGSNFSMIEKIDQDGIPIIKIGGHFQRSAIDDLDNIWQKELSEQEISWSKDHVMRYLKMLKLPLDGSQLNYENGYSCVYSLTETEVPYVTFGLNKKMVVNENLLVLGGMSGVGAKGAMTYGLIGTNMLLNETEEGDMYELLVDELGISRLLADLEVPTEQKE